MIIPDVNLLVYAHNESAPQHEHALRWWEDLALAIEHQADLCSNDADFGRFRGLRWVNPLRS